MSVPRLLRQVNGFMVIEKEREREREKEKVVQWLSAAAESLYKLSALERVRGDLRTKC